MPPTPDDAASNPPSGPVPTVPPEAGRPDASPWGASIVTDAAWRATPGAADRMTGGTTGDRPDDVVPHPHADPAAHPRGDLAGHPHGDLASDRAEPVIPGRPDYAPTSAGPASGAAVTDAPPAGAPDDLFPAPRPRRSGWTRTAGPEPDEDPAEPTAQRLLRRLLGEATLALDATRRARVLGWLLPLAVTLFGAVLRFWNLGNPHQLVFDETYYVKDAYSLLHQGYEANWEPDPNAKFEAGTMSGILTTGEYVVHPQVGKWMIALGMWLGGGPTSSTAWRLGAAVVGTLSVLMVARIGRRLFASTALGTVAGLLLAVDGEAVVQSRVSLLDPFLMFFVLAAFGALLLDRDRSRRRLADRAAAVIDAGGDLASGLGPRLGWRWWRLAAAVLLGLAIGTKWSGIYFLAVFGLLSVLGDLQARRTVGVRRWFEAGIFRDGVVAGVSMVGIAFVVYVGSWFSWFMHPNAYLRQWAAQNPGQGVQWLPESLRSLLHYHQEMWRFHNGLDSAHPYAAHPLGWIAQWRPTSMWYPTSISSLYGDQAQAACGSDRCSQAITAIGNPLVWWGATAAIVVAVAWFLKTRDWRALAVLSGIVAGWLPWFGYAHRTIFTFYSVAFVPWVVLTLVYVLGIIVGPRVVGAPAGDVRARKLSIVAVGVFVAAAVAVGLYFYPIWSAWTVPWWFWHSHMWLPSWV